MTPQLVRPAGRPLIAHLLRPEDPKTGRPFEATRQLIEGGEIWMAMDRPWTPVEVEGCLIWTTNDRTWTPMRLITFTIPDNQTTWANLVRRWWSYGVEGGAGLLDVATGRTRVVPNVHSPVDENGIDEHGVPVGLRDEPDAVYGRPSHGETPLKLPPTYVDSIRVPSAVIAAPKGKMIAGALTLGSAEDPKSLPFVWSDDGAEPRGLAMPNGYTHRIVSAMNSRGDVAGLVTEPGLPNRVLIWKADGNTVQVPIGWDESKDFGKDPDKRAPWSASEPISLTDDGILIGREDKVHGHITTYWDGQRTIWLPDAIEGVKVVRFAPIRLAADGRSLLMNIWNGKVWGWYRVSPR